MTQSETIYEKSVLKVDDLGRVPPRREAEIRQGWRLCRDGQRRGQGSAPKSLSELLRAFWGKVEMRGNDECWYWKAGVNSANRPLFWLEGKQWNASRVSYLLSYGELKMDSFVCHHCDQMLCVNPAHLYVGDAQSNQDDIRARGRSGKRVKLDWAQVNEIRSLYNPGVFGQKKVARYTGIKLSTVRAVLSGKVWKPLP